MNNDAIGIAKQLHIAESQRCCDHRSVLNVKYDATARGSRRFLATSGAPKRKWSSPVTTQRLKSFFISFFSPTRHSHVVHFTKFHRPPIATHSHVEDISENPNCMINGHIYIVVFATPLSLFIDVTVIAHTNRSELCLYAKHMSSHTCHEMSSHSRQQQVD